MYIEVNNNLEAALREFKRKVKKEEILQDLRKHEHYTAPSKKSREKHENALKRHRRELKESENASKRIKTNNSRRSS